MWLPCLLLYAAGAASAQNRELSSPLEKMNQLFKHAAEHSDYSELKTPERIVHTTGYGAGGYFEVTDDISHLSKASVFKPGTKTPIQARFSLLNPGRNIPDSAHNERGLAVRFYTDCGNWDLLGTSFGLFFVSEASDVPFFIDAMQQGNFAEAQNIMSRHPEAAFHFIVQSSYMGAPISSRHMDIGAIHTYKLVSENGTLTYVKFRFISEQGAKYQDFNHAQEMSEKNPNHAREDLQNAIASGEYPAWKLMIQTMSFDAARQVPFDIADPTYIWPSEEFPLQPLGRIVLNKNPENYAEEIEKLAFNPGHLIPGIEPSHDPVFFFRMLAYAQMQERRLGENYMEIPVNRPKHGVNSHDMEEPNHEHVVRFDLKENINHLQAAKWYHSRLADEQKQIAMLTAESLQMIPAEIRDRQLANFDRVDKELGNSIRTAGGW